MTNVGDGQFLQRLRRELHTHGGHKIGVICASLDFTPAGAAEWVRAAAVSDAVRRLHREVSGCDWIEAEGTRIRLLVHGSVADLVNYAEQALQCLKRTSRMEGALPARVQVGLTISTTSEPPGELMRRSRDLAGATAGAPG